MGFRNGAYAKVWETRATRSPKVTQGRISISYKNKTTGQYEEDFSHWVSFLGQETAEKALNLSQSARIKLGEVDVSAKYDKTAGKKYYDFKVYSFEVVGSASDTADAGASASASVPSVPAGWEDLNRDPAPGEVEDEGLPFN